MRDAVGADLLAALGSYVRVGLAREPAFRVVAVLLADALFRDLPDLPLEQERRLKLGQTVDFDPQQHRPEPDEKAFGGAYDIPSS